MPESRLIIETGEKITQVRFTDCNILEESQIQQLGDEMGQLIDQSTHPCLLLVFENVEHLSSAALGMLITVNNRVRQKGGQLRLSNIGAQIYEVFIITKLNNLFQIFDQVD
jgi:anti-sigma B factor antagonist